MKKLTVVKALLCSVGLSHNLQAAEVDYDPWEPVNSKIHAFNDFMDRNLLRPVAVGYTRYVPSPARRGVSNFFSNIGDFSILANNILQFKFEHAANDTGRIMLNSTFGIAGILDLASSIGLDKNDEDFGQTLGYWGIGPGPYVVLPFLGASTVRDTFGLTIDTLTNPLNHQNNMRIRNTAYALEQIDSRVAVMAIESLMSGDPYLFTREAYLQQRAFLVSDGQVDDWDDDWGDWD